jgi:hypothetical protein
MVGSADILASQTESFARFRATQHVASEHVIDVDGDTATLRADLIAMHLWDQATGLARGLLSRLTRPNGQSEADPVGMAPARTAGSLRLPHRRGLRCHAADRRSLAGHFMTTEALTQGASHTATGHSVISWISWR